MRTLVTNGVHEYELEGFTIKHNEEGTAWIFFSPMDEIWKPAASLEEACKKINAELDCLLLRDVGIERDFEQIDSAHEVQRNAVYRVLAEQMQQSRMRKSRRSTSQTLRSLLSRKTDPSSAPSQPVTTTRRKSSRPSAI